MANEKAKFLGRSEEFKIDGLRAIWTDGLFKPQKNDQGVEKYGCTLLWPKTNVALTTKMKQVCEQVALDSWKEKTAQLVQNQLVKLPLLDGDGPQGVSKKTGERRPEYVGHWFIRPQSVNKPTTVDRAVLPAGPDVIYSGCYVNAVVNVYAYDHPKSGLGLSVGLSMVQFARDGERVGGGGGPRDPNEFFEKIPDEGAAPVATQGGAGAGGLFG